MNLTLSLIVILSLLVVGGVAARVTVENVLAQAEQYRGM